MSSDEALAPPQATSVAMVGSEALRAYREVARGPLGLPSPPAADATASPAYPFVVAHRSIVEAVSSTLDAATAEVTAVVHLSQEVAVHRPLRAGDRVTVASRVQGARHHPGGARVSVRSALEDADGRPVADLVSGLLLVGAAGVAPFGDVPPHPVRAAPAEEAVLASCTIPADLPGRYADVSGDHNPIHVDRARALAAGFPDVVVQGICLLAMVCEAVVARFAAADAAQVRSVGARFGRPVVPGDVLDLGLRHDPGDHVVGFSARARGGTALKHGWVQLACGSVAPSGPRSVAS